MTLLKKVYVTLSEAKGLSIHKQMLRFPPHGKIHLFSVDSRLFLILIISFKCFIIPFFA